MITIENISTTSSLKSFKVNISLLSPSLKAFLTTAIGVSSPLNSLIISTHSLK